MKFDKVCIFSLIAPLMISFSSIGLVFKEDNKKIFYLPIGLMGIVIITEKYFTRKLRRQNILKKIRSHNKIK